MSNTREIGIVDSWDALKVAQVVRMLVDADEVERALLVLDNVPARYREIPDPMLLKLRGEILGSMITAHGYLSSTMDADVSIENALLVLNHQLRGKILYAEVTQYNKQLRTPHIIDVGPGEYFVPIGLSQRQKVFTYEPISMDSKARQSAEEILASSHIGRVAIKDEPTIFVALEIIEHLPDPRDLAIEAAKYTDGKMPDRIHLSTPHYTYDGRPKSCGRHALPHLRAYTSHEFVAEANRIFKGYDWHLYGGGEILSLRGCKREKGVETPQLELEA